MRAMRLIAPTLAAALLAALALGGSPAGACACGIAIEATVNDESGLVIEGEGTETIVLSLDLTSDGSERAAVILPVPAEPEVEAVQGGDPLEYLDVATAPPVTAVGSSGGEDASAAPPVDVLGREEIGGYDVSRLAADDPEALNDWLDDNGYSVPDGAEPIFSEYIDEGWKFVAIRLAGPGDGVLKPLAVEFPVAAEEFVYPMRLSQLSSAPVNLDLYTLADGPRRAGALVETFAGEVADLEPAVPKEMEELFSQGEVVTRLEANGADPATFTSDIAIEGELTIEPAAGTDASAEEDAVAAGGEGELSTLELILIVLTGAGLIAVLGLVAWARGHD